MDIIEKVREIATPIIDQNDCILFDVTFKKEGKDLFLRLFVDKKVGKIDLDLIVKISEQLSIELDQADLITSNYMLDVSSVGAERPIALEDLPSYVGYYVHLHLSHPYLGMNDIEGDIIMIENDTLILQYKDKARVKKANLLLSTIDRARLAIKF